MSARGWPSLLIAILLLHLALVLPAAPEALFLRFAPELPVLVFAAACLGGRRMLVTAGLFPLAVQKIADLAMLQVLGRPFNLVADLALIDAGLRVTAGSFGARVSVVLALGALVAAAAILWGLWWPCRVLGQGPWTAPARAALAGLSAATVALPATGALGAANSAYARDRLQLARDTAAGLRELRAAAAADPFVGAAGVLDAIDRNLLVIFVESYGRTSFDTPDYAARHLQTLREMERQLAGAGLSMRSGFLRAPTKGGAKLAVACQFCQRVVDQRPGPVSRPAGQRAARAVPPRRGRKRGAGRRRGLGLRRRFQTSQGFRLPDAAPHPFAGACAAPTRLIPAARCAAAPPSGAGRPCSS